MENIFQEIKEQIHQIRNLVGPFDLKLANLEHDLAELRILSGEKVEALESKLFGMSLKQDEQSKRISDLLERVQWIEASLKVPPKPGSETRLPDRGIK